VAEPEPKSRATRSRGIPGLATSPNAPDRVWVPVLSSFLVKVMYAGAQYNRKGEETAPGRLWIQFWQHVGGGRQVPGKTFHYRGVPREVWNGLLAASSKGKYFHQVIRGNYPFNPV
jgi:hypothetical protein